MHNFISMPTMSSPAMASATPVMAAAPTEMSVRPVSVISVRPVTIIEAVIRTLSVISYGGAIRIGINGAALHD